MLERRMQPWREHVEVSPQSVGTLTGRGCFRSAGVNGVQSYVDTDPNCQGGVVDMLAAADVLGRNPGSIQLRYLQTLADIANERSSIVAFPIPVDLLSRLAGNGSQDKPPQ